MEAIIDEVERELFNSTEHEVTTHAVGEGVMSKLRKLDEVAYVRFASVYRQFKDLNEFMSELKGMLADDNVRAQVVRAQAAGVSSRQS